MTTAGRLALAAALLALVTGCAGAPALPGGEATHSALRQHYRQHALERDGRCRAPYLDGILASEVVEQAADVTTLRVRYAYRDLIGDETQGRRRPAADRCQGIGERTFTLATGPGGARVVEMSGLKRGDPLPALFQ